MNMADIATATHAALKEFSNAQRHAGQPFDAHHGLLGP